MAHLAGKAGELSDSKSKGRADVGSAGDLPNTGIREEFAIPLPSKEVRQA
jgi:hypothetical protein